MPELIEKGHRFSSETDTEVLAHLIEEYLVNDLPSAVRKALERVEGSYAMGVLWAKEPQTLIAARNHSPLVVGVEAGASFMASDIPALLPYTNKVIFLEDREMVVLRPDSMAFMSTDDGASLEKEVTIVDWSASMAEKAGYKHFMLKEIFEQPQAIINTVSGRIIPDTGEIDLAEINLEEAVLKSIERVAIVACGTSWHAAHVAKYWLDLNPQQWATCAMEWLL